MRLRLALAAAAAGPLPLFLGTSFLGWTALIGLPPAFVMPAFCGTAAGQSDLHLWRAFPSALQFDTFGALVFHWLLMLLAMMPLLLSEPLSYLWRRSLSRRRFRAIAAFLAGYLTVWVLVGIPLTLAATAQGNAMSSSALRALLPIAIALVWQLTPAKQICLNRCHRLPRLAAFGSAADRDCLGYGIVSAIWCVGACWALMLVPLAIDRWNLVVMAVVSVVLIAERQIMPRPARWGLLRPAL